jgi:hypothetical protein
MLRPPKDAVTELSLICRLEARQQFLSNIPEVLSNLVGQQNARRGAMKVFETLQDPKLNKQLFYVSCTSQSEFVSVSQSQYSCSVWGFPIEQGLGLSQRWLWRMPSSGMWHHVGLLWTDISEERVLVRCLQCSPNCSQSVSSPPTLCIVHSISSILRWRRHILVERQFTRRRCYIPYCIRKSQLNPFHMFLPCFKSVEYYPPLWSNGRGFDSRRY